MQKSNQSGTFILQYSAGVFGGTILGVVGFVTFMQYGGQHGCWPIIDSLYNLRGYESCGLFGLQSGIILGSILAIGAAHFITSSRAKLLSLILFWSAFVLPLLFGLLTFGPPYSDGFITSTLAVAMFMLFASIPTLLILGIVRAIKYLKKR